MPSMYIRVHMGGGLFTLAPRPDSLKKGQERFSPPVICISFNENLSLSTPFRSIFAQTSFGRFGCELILFFFFFFYQSTDFQLLQKHSIPPCCLPDPGRKSNTHCNFANLTLLHSINDSSSGPTNKTFLIEEQRGHRTLHFLFSPFANDCLNSSPTAESADSSCLAELSLQWLCNSRQPFDSVTQLSPCTFFQSLSSSSLKSRRQLQKCSSKSGQD